MLTASHLPGSGRVRASKRAQDGSQGQLDDDVHSTLRLSENSRLLCFHMCLGRRGMLCDGRAAEDAGMPSAKVVVEFHCETNMIQQWITQFSMWR
jgi:hypothetical protein